MKPTWVLTEEERERRFKKTRDRNKKTKSNNKDGAENNENNELESGVENTKSYYKGIKSGCKI